MKSKIGIVKMKRTLGLLLAAACFCGGFGKTTAQETLKIRYTEDDGSSHIRQVAKDVDTLVFRDTIALHLPEGLTKLYSLVILGRTGKYNISLSQPLPLSRLRLPKDIGKDAEVPLRVTVVAVLPNDFTLQVHKDRVQFSLRVEAGNSWQKLKSYRVEIPSAKDLIRNRVPDDDGVFRIPYVDSTTGSREFTIEVHGLESKIWVERREGGVDIAWNRGRLQSAPSIDGPWTDITFDNTRRLSIRSSSPAEFFRVKPQE